MRARQKGDKLAVPTFAQNLHELHKLKQQLLTLNHIFSPESLNYHQLRTISNMKKELQLSQQELRSVKESAMNEQHGREDLVAKLERERKQLEEVNMELVGYNDKLVEQLEATSAKLEALAQDLQHQKQMRKQMEIKHAREMENLKLMHSQQLYILKKKDRKTAA